ncbi:MAG: pirin family protein, partial [Bdellovibrionales bacterium]|nr:pirin family protein [Bdellovibrionales bacterium]
IQGREKDLGGFKVSRYLPTIGTRMIGPFIFIDQMGPAKFAPGQGIDVRPHPHIGLSTFTYLFEGSIFHRDSLGTELEIYPGAVNWMTSGSGIAHSERTSPKARASGQGMHGLQTWVALPKDLEDQDPQFHHYAADSIPDVRSERRHIRVVVGSLAGKTSPVKAASETSFFEVRAASTDILDVGNLNQDLGVLVINGSVEVQGTLVHQGQLLKADSAKALVCIAKERAHYIILGGKPFPEERFIWWNFVSSSQEKIELAKIKWKEGLFPTVPGETESIPLPEK